MFCWQSESRELLQVKDGLFRICQKIVGEEQAIDCMLQLEAFKRKEGCFGSVLTLAMADKMPAYQWWGADACVEEAGELKSVASKVSTTTAIIWPVLRCKL